MDKVCRINGHEVKFYVNEENRIVAACIEGLCNDAINNLRDSFHLNIDVDGTSKKIYQEMEMPERLKAVAKCHHDDVFDVEIGKQKAYKKLNKKYWKKFSVRMYNMREIFIRAACHAATQAGRAKYRSDRIEI